MGGHRSLGVGGGLRSLSVAACVSSSEATCCHRSDLAGGRCRVPQAPYLLAGGMASYVPESGKPAKNICFSFLEVSADNACEKLASEAQCSIGT